MERPDRISTGHFYILGCVFARAGGGEGGELQNIARYWIENAGHYFVTKTYVNHLQC